MMELFVSWVFNAVALYATATYVPGLHIDKGVTGFAVALIGAAILALVNRIIKPILLILTLPINILTLGLFTFVVSGITFWLMTVVTPGIHAENFLACIIGAVSFGFLNWVLHLMVL